jgi:hypothetical protein
MAQATTHRSDTPQANDRMPQGRLEDSPMMAHLLKALRSRKDIGHYGRLVFAIVARHFLEEREMVRFLASQPDFDEDQARSLVAQVKARDYNPPRRETILRWQARQDFPITPNPADPDSGNVYRELPFPEGVYDEIEEYYEEKADASGS